MKIDYLHELNEHAEYSPWITMPDVDWSSVTEGLQPKLFKKNTIIYHQKDKPDYVYLVKKGRVRLDIYGFNGEKISLFIADQGTFFGELSPIDAMPNMCSATAATDSLLYAIPTSAFIAEVNRNHAFACNILQMMAKKIRLISMQVGQLSFNDAYYRVCYALSNLIRQYGKKESDDTYRLRIKFTHQEMADLTGLSRVTVSNILSSMTCKGIIEKKDGYLIVKNLDSVLQYLLEKE